MSGAAYQNNLDGFANTNNTPILPPISTTPKHNIYPHSLPSTLPYDYRQPLPAPNQSPWPTQPRHSPPFTATSPTVPAKRRLSAGAFSDPIIDSRDQAKGYNRRGAVTTPNASTHAGASSLHAHVCHICQRVYERADHLTRHLRSHENARSYACTRCPKRFNRADLLSRHEATHDRDGSRGRNSNRRTDRASEACANCAASKSKCDDRKPCSRCVLKDLACNVPPRRCDQRWEDDDAVPEVSSIGTYPPTSYESLPAASTTPNAPQARTLPPVSTLVEAGTPAGASMSFTATSAATTNTTAQTSEASETPKNLDPNRMKSSSPTLMTDNPPDAASQLEQQAEMLFASDELDKELFKSLTSPMTPIDNEPSWDDDLENMSLPRHLLANISPLAARDPVPCARRKELTKAERDDIFAMVLDVQLKEERPKTFPSRAFLNDLFQSFVLTHKQSQHGWIHWIHWASWIQACNSHEFLAAVIAYAAVDTRVDDIVRFGRALGNAVTKLILNRVSMAGSNFIDLLTAQTSIICIEAGMWSGSTCAMELSNRLLVTLITKLRLCGKISLSSPLDDGCSRPATQKPATDRNWKIFVRTESYRRLVLRLYMDDSQLAVAQGKLPFMSFGELTFKLPAAPQLWHAASIDQWHASLADLRRGGKELPCVADLMEGLGLVSRKNIDEHDDDIATKAILHGFYGLVAAYRETLKSYMPGPRAMPSVYIVPAKPTSLLSHHEDLYRDFCAFTVSMQDIPDDDGSVGLFAEFLKLLMFVSVDHLQTFSNTAGAAELARALRHTEREWESNNHARYALWHAAQVIRQSKQLTRGSLCGLSAAAVYYAALTLWAYNSIIGQVSIIARWRSGVDPEEHFDLVALDGEETGAVKAFLDNNVGHPAVRLDSGPEEKRTHMLDTAIGLMLDHHPMNDMAMPPLVSGFMQSLNRLKNGKF